MVRKPRPQPRLRRGPAAAAEPVGTSRPLHFSTTSKDVSCMFRRRPDQAPFVFQAGSSFASELLDDGIQLFTQTWNSNDTPAAKCPRVQSRTSVVGAGDRYGSAFVQDACNGAGSGLPVQLCRNASCGSRPGTSGSGGHGRHQAAAGAAWAEG